MTNQELYKQAILDAKAVRETAMAVAKESLAEAFEPRIKEMLRLKLAEELGEVEEPVDEFDETKEEVAKATPKMEESTLDEILAELDALSKTGEKVGDVKGMVEVSDEETEEEEEVVADEAGDVVAGEEAAIESADDEQVVDITVGELKDIFRDIFAQLQGEQEPVVADSEGDLESADAEISLDELLAELEGDEKKMEGAAAVKAKASNNQTMEEKVGMKKELEEAKKVINTMRAELQEVNLLNAKLLYVNKLWKAKSLTESQKVKVLNAFDRVTTVKEAENVFKTLSESFSGAPKKGTLKESMGFASKAIGTAPTIPIVEVDSMVARWKHIAGIK